MSYLIARLGINWIEVRRLDLVTFQGAVRSMKRTEALEKKESAWTMMHAAQGDYKAMKSWLEQYEEYLQDYDVEPANDLERFLASKHGKGV